MELSLLPDVPETNAPQIAHTDVPLDDNVHPLSAKLVVRLNKKKHTIKSSRDPKVPLPNDEDYVSFIKSTVYTLPQLKYICRQMKLRVTGKKSELKQHIQTCLLRGWSIRKIQKAWRIYCAKQWSSSRGPARFRRDLCVNPTDFCTMDSVTEIPFCQFISYKDIDGKIYGFDMISLYDLYHNENMYSSELPINPYNRAPIPFDVYICLMRLIHISKVLYGINIHARRAEEEEEKEVYEILNQDQIMLQPEFIRAAQLDHDITSLFRDMDNLGNYTNAGWFSQLDRTQILKFLTELNDIWSHRANLTLRVKREISPSGNPFILAHCHHLETETMDFESIRWAAIRVMFILVHSGINRDSRALGTMFILGALSLVSLDAALALPWLYESMV